MTTNNNPKSVSEEELARKLHEWYLEATSQDGAKYNHEAVVPYDDLPEGSKLLDRYIARKVNIDCEERVRAAVEEERGRIQKIINRFHFKGERSRNLDMRVKAEIIHDIVEALTPPKVNTPRSLTGEGD